MLADTSSIALLEIGILLGGLISGFSGFAFSAVAGVFLLSRFEPLFAVPLMVLCGLLTQLYSVYSLRRQMKVDLSLPFILGGLVGVPAGLYALHAIEPHAFRLAFGAFVALYAGWALLSGAVGRLVSPRPASNALVGFGGGVVGGLTAMPGALPIMWCDAAGMSKEDRRGVVQPFIVVMQLSAALIMIARGTVTPQMWWSLAISLPALLIGTIIGLMLYRRVTDALFRKGVLLLLAASGVGLALKSLTVG